MSELAQGSSQVRHRYVLAVRLSAPSASPRGREHRRGSAGSDPRHSHRPGKSVGV